MSQTKRSAEVKLTIEGAEETTERAGEVLEQITVAGEKLEEAASSLEAFVSKASDLAQRFGEL